MYYNMIVGRIMKIRYIFLVALAYIFAGCAGNEPKISFNVPEHVEQMPDKMRDNVNNTGSLFGDGDSPLFGDRKAMKVNDLVTVVISESVQASSSSQKKLERANESNLGGGIMTAPSNNMIDGVEAASGISRSLGVLRNKFNALANVGFSTKSDSDFEGKGSNDRNESFSTKITARVVKVMRNETYYIEGTRELLINGEKQFIKIGGIVRADDITKDNSVDSSYLANAKVLYLTEGDLKNASKKGWLSQAMDTVWPF
jgi:flagellar L-ring protein precursor FlgH